MNTSLQSPSDSDDRSPHILLFEDDPAALLGLAAELSRAGFHHVTTSRSREHAQKLLTELAIDLAVLDIHTDNHPEAGLELAKVCEARGTRAIFTTGKESHIEAALAYRPAALLFKPFQNQTFISTVRLAARTIKEGEMAATRPHPIAPPRDTLEEAFFFVRQRSVYIRVAYVDVLYICSDTSIITICTKQQKYSISSALINVERQLSSPLLERIDKSYIVNLIAIHRFDTKSVFFGPDETSPSLSLSRTALSTIKQRLKILTAK